MSNELLNKFLNSNTNNEYAIFENVKNIDELLDHILYIMSLEKFGEIINHDMYMSYPILKYPDNNLSCGIFEISYKTISIKGYIYNIVKRESLKEMIKNLIYIIPYIIISVEITDDKHSFYLIAEYGKKGSKCWNLKYSRTEYNSSNKDLSKYKNMLYFNNLYVNVDLKHNSLKEYVDEHMKYVCWSSMESADLLLEESSVV